MDESQIIFVLTTVNSREAGIRIGETLLSEKTAACINIIPGIYSLYRWKEQLERDEELLLLIKTSKDKQNEVFERVRALHDYDVPEIISIQADSVDKAYADWLRDCLK